MSVAMKIGDKAPDFSLVDRFGEKVSLSSFRGKTAVVLFFYPKDNTPFCTSEACSFRDHYETFKELGAEVIGISADSGSSHEGFASRHHLPFVLLSDPGGTVRERYGIPKTFGLLPGRVTFVIDKNGVIRHVFSSQFRAKKHVDEAIRIVRSIHSESDIA
jgi:peroxiredoxin Q/BCP